jgi:hypothetical protein
MNEKSKLPAFDRSLFTVDCSLNDKINSLASNPDFQENHKKLRSLIRHSNQKQEV